MSQRMGELCNSCNMGMGDLPDMHALALGLVALGLQAYISGKSRMPMLQVPIDIIGGRGLVGCNKLVNKTKLILY